MSKDKISVGLNDDYVTAYVMDENYNDIVSLYYGYESFHCPDHDSEDDCWDVDCDKGEWCFTLSDINDNEVKLPASSIEEDMGGRSRGQAAEILLGGVAKLLKDGILVIDEEKLKNYKENLHKSN